MWHIGVIAAQIGCEEAMAAVGVEFEDADVGIAVVAAVVGTHRDGIAVAEDQAGGVGVLVAVVACRCTPVVGCRASVGREVEIRVDDEHFGGVVFP